MGNACKVIVNYKSGSHASGVKVGYDVGGNITCIGGGTSGYTDSNGEVIVSWSEGCKCTYIYINGTGHKGPFNSGGTYFFNV